jgi:nitroreductase
MPTMDATDVIDNIIETRSIRKYTQQQVPRAVLERILEAGTHAANAGGAQRTVLVGINNAQTAAQLGRLNLAKFDRSGLIGNYVSADQPSVIDDPSLKNGFYGAPSVVVIFAQADFYFGVPDAFCCAQTMAFAAHSLGVSSCIVSRAEDTFAHPEAQAMAAQWGVPAGYQARCFLTLGYCAGVYPAPKPRKDSRVIVVD